jgi:hypothetical protein
MRSEVRKKEGRGIMLERMRGEYFWYGRGRKEMGEGGGT